MRARASSRVLPCEREDLQQQIGVLTEERDLARSWARQFAFWRCSTKQQPHRPFVRLSYLSLSVESERREERGETRAGGRLASFGADLRFSIEARAKEELLFDTLAAKDLRSPIISQSLSLSLSLSLSVK